MGFTLLYDDRFLDHHDVGYHPESPDRLPAIVDVMTDRGLWERAEVIGGREATVDELARNHDRGYVEFALEHMKRAPGRFDADTFFSEGSRSAALLAAGGTLDLVAGVVERRWDFGFAIPRPPGHHATPRRAMGFCIFNNLAVAAHAALASGEVERILVFDWDLHHGNGTQESFWSDGRLLYVSIHQWPFFPGSGLSDEVGAGGGRGTSVNFPFPPGAGNDEYACVIREVLTPLADEFSPDLVLVSVGFDTHMDDLIGSMKVDEDGFAAMARSVADIAGRHAGGRLALVLEGGYNIQAEAQSAARVVETLLGAEAEIPAGRPRPAYRDVMDRTLKEIAPYWKGVL